ncbi:hypothetical protein DRA24_17970 [Salmonella enterica subsp. enterica serovar Mississippi]|nr:hypothetical protein [Salmonella enterica subsp. enterica serovar Mississippi]
MDLSSAQNPHILRVRSGFCALSVPKLAAPITPGGIGSNSFSRQITPSGKKLMAPTPAPIYINTTAVNRKIACSLILNKARGAILNKRNNITALITLSAHKRKKIRSLPPARPCAVTGVTERHTTTNDRGIRHAEASWK